MALQNFHQTPSFIFKDLVLSSAAFARMLWMQKIKTTRVLLFSSKDCSHQTLCGFFTLFSRKEKKRKKKNNGSLHIMALIFVTHFQLFYDNLHFKGRFSEEAAPDVRGPSSLQQLTGHRTAGARLSVLLNSVQSRPSHTASYLSDCMVLFRPLGSAQG